MGRLVILSGPSCVGKGPLHAALKRFYPDLADGLRQLVLYNSRPPRPGEEDGVDYHFRPRGEIEALRDEEGYTVMEVRGDLQAVDMAELADRLAEGDVFFEGNPFVGRALLEAPAAGDVEMLTAFLAPLSREELLYLREPERGVSLPDFVADVMRRKLLRRTTKQKGILSLKDLEEVERRATSAYRELRLAHHFRHVIPNHDGEDSENWTAFYYPVGDARRALVAFAELLAGREPDWLERWEPDLLP
jgi:guanylate kinase